MALFPFILIKDKSGINDSILLNHEKIHLRQQLELLVIPFYLLYVLIYLLNRLKYEDHYLAYRGIIFEKEAYLFEKDLNYLRKRRFWAWRYAF